MSEQLDVDYISGAIAQAQAKIEELQSAIKTLESLRSLGIGGAGITPGAVGGSVTFSHDAFFGMTIAEASKKYLTAIKKTSTVAALCDALLSGGLKSSSSNMRENVRSILGRHPDFVRINGEFGLAEWYPGRKAAAKRSSSNPPEVDPPEPVDPE